MSKPGRKRRKGVTRTKSGRISRSKPNKSRAERLTEVETLRPGIEARRRHYGVSEEVAAFATTGYLLGRLLEAGLFDASFGISQSQHDAAMQYAEIKRKYLKSIEPPKGLGAVNLNPMPGYALHLEDEAQHIKRVQRSVSAYMGALGAIQRADLLGETAITRALDDENLNEKQMGALRISLNALGKYLRGG